jgi:ribosomal protein S18 acetylase RimI-like enzyme
MIDLHTIETDADLAACFPLMHQLRPHLASAQEFIDRVRRQAGTGYRLVALWQGAAPCALAGWRLQENLVHGRFLYVDDLVTDAAARSQGHGHRLMTHLLSVARTHGCGKLLLDTPISNTRGQDFYLREGLATTALRFAVALG